MVFLLGYTGKILCKAHKKMSKFICILANASAVFAIKIAFMGSLGESLLNKSDSALEAYCEIFLFDHLCAAGIFSLAYAKIHLN